MTLNPSLDLTFASPLRRLSAAAPFDSAESRPA